MTISGVAVGGCAAGTTPPRPSPFPTAALSAPSADAAGAPGSLRLSAVVDDALQLQGVPYRAGGESPATGFDCSGFVRYVFAKHHVDLPRTVNELYALGARVGRQEIRAGDLVYFSTVAPGASHIGIAIDGVTFVHAPSSNGVVRVERLDVPYWRDRFFAAKRLIATE
jgi:cell wall-associated NlpC family hydrolase